MKERLSKLLCIKSIVTLVVTTVFAVLSLRGDISLDNVMRIISMAISFYFGTQHEKKGSRKTHSLKAGPKDILGTEYPLRYVGVETAYTVK